jgi:Flp pilus assembly protein TadG
MFMLLLGIIELGRGLMLKHMLTNAARAGCRVGVVEGTKYDDVVAGVNATLTPIGISSDTVTVQVNDVTGNGLVNTASATDELTVIVSVPMSTVSWVPYPQYLPSSLSGQYTLRRE